MKYGQLKLTLIALLFSTFAGAQTATIQCSNYWKYPVPLTFSAFDNGLADIRPDNGWYNAGWHGASAQEATGGKWGLNIEIQEGSLALDGYLFGSAFIPDEDGTPTYRIFNGPIQYKPKNLAAGGDLATFEATMFRPVGGTCIGCPHKAVGSPNGADAPEGNIKITWHDNRNATLEWGGKSIEIAHWQWADNIGLNHADWVQGNYLAIAEYSYLSIVGHANGANGPFNDNRVRATTSATVTRTNNIPAALEGHDWAFYDVNMEQVAINVYANGDPGGGQEDPNKFRAGTVDNSLRGYLLVYKPEDDRFDVYVRPSNGQLFNELGTNGFPIMRGFVASQNEILAFGYTDPAGTQSVDTIEKTFLKLYRLPPGWNKALTLPAAPYIDVCARFES